jgi:hypothetical protein
MLIESQFSEFSYGYAITEHYVRSLWPHAMFAPRFPTLRRERYLGYDVRISGFGFFQFKRANGHDGRAIKERPRRFGFVNPSVIYRMPLSASGPRNQHDRLLRLEALVGNRANVLYACPAFATMDKFNKAYRQQEVPRRSMFVRPSAIGALTDERHHVSFNRGSVDRGFAWCFSDPIQIAPMSYQATGADLANRAGSRLMDTESLVGLANEVQGLYREYGYEGPELPPALDDASRAFRSVIKLAVMLRSGFDIEPVILGDHAAYPYWDGDFLPF